MLTFLNRKQMFCDRIARRSFLKIGSVVAGGLTSGLSLPQLLQAEQRAGIQNSSKSVIMVYLSGGIAHQDTVDLKPHAPDGIRGEFKPIDTAVPGIQICELLPQLAQVTDKLAILRSITGLRDEHSSFQNITGYSMGESQRDGWPHFGSVVSQLRAPSDAAIPAFVDLFPTMQHRPYNSPGPGMLGSRYAGVKADGEDLASMKLRFISPTQLDKRRQLLDAFDQYRRTVDNARVTGVDATYQRAFDVLTSSRLVDAMDVAKEDPAVRARYGKTTSKHLGDGAPLWNDQLLIARRLIEAGVRCVTVAYGFWDTHGHNFSHMKQHLPAFDQGIAALVRDLYERGLDQDVTLIVWGEFGRTPKINKDAGRDHWARVNSAILSGGGMRVGQVIGSTDAMADSAKDRPIHYLDVLATMYQRLGIDPHEMMKDVSERPVPVLSGLAHPIRELT